jgi:flagellar biosynthesis/type III secretory pathway chaperone
VTATLPEILDSLASETRLHARLLDVVRQEQGALVRGDADDLLRILRAQDEIVAEIRDLEASRAARMGDWAEAAGKAPEAVTIRDLAALAGPEDAARLHAARDELADLLRAVAAANQSNSILIRDHLAHIRNVVDLVTRTFSGATYGPAEGRGAPVSLVVDRMT